MTTDTLQADDDPHKRRRGRYLATVAANVPLCREHNRLTFHAPGFPACAPGQFVQVRCRDVDEAPMGQTQQRLFEWPAEQPRAGRLELDQPDLLRPTPILRRPFSIAGRRDGAGVAQIDLINRDIGPGTHWLFALREGQQVDLIGPLGNSFTYPEPGGTALLVGGGVGIPPMIYLAQGLSELNAAAGEARREAVAFCGALMLDLLPLTITDAVPDAVTGAVPRHNIAEFARFGFPTVISTDDGSYGFPGRVTEALVHYLDEHEGAPGNAGSPAPILYTCGPEPMMKAVAAIARQRGLRCQVAVERAMACGMGTCQSCVIRQIDAGERGWRYRLACTDGPIFDAATLLW